MTERRRHLIDCHLPWSPLNRPAAILDRDRGILASNGRHKICIYGCGHGALEAPLEDDTWQVWALNTVPPLDRERRLRADLWWDLHQRCAQSADDLRWFRELPMPLMTTGDMLEAVGPHALRYPLERVITEVAAGPFACTFAYQIAYALLVGYRDIGLYGIDLAYGDTRERTVEWASVNWWMGFAEARGVRFYRPRHSRLGRHPRLYGFEYDAEIFDTKAYVKLWQQWDADEHLRKDKRASVGG